MSSPSNAATAKPNLGASDLGLIQDLLDTFDVAAVTRSVPATLVHRHFGIPAGGVADESVRSVLDRTAGWLDRNASAWVSGTAHAVTPNPTRGWVRLSGTLKLRSSVLASGFHRQNVPAVAVCGFSAGRAVDERVRRLWELGCPDEAMALNARAIALVEHLRASMRRHLSSGLRDHGWATLPHYSPGYPGWDLGGQSTLLKCLHNPGPLELLPSGGLLPSKSTLCLFGLCSTGDAIDAASSDYWERQTTANRPSPSVAATSREAAYGFSERALEKWRRDRLTLQPNKSGGWTARFRVGGSTCTNMGMPLALEYQVALRTNGDGSTAITRMKCGPADGDTGHRSTCLFLSGEREFRDALDDRPPLLGAELADVLRWVPETDPAGCPCTRASRNHKWRIVLQTIHYALSQKHAESNHSPR